MSCKEKIKAARGKSYICRMWLPKNPFTAMQWALCAAALFFFTGCLAQGQTPSAVLPYYLDKPALRAELADELHEISGLQMAPNDADLLAVQDERGAVYVLDGANMKIKRRIDFISEGDFEGVTAVGDTLYAVKSTGTIYRVMHGGTPAQITDKFKYTLTKQQDIEGIAADPARRLLLLACKAAPPEQAQDEKHIYTIRMDDMTLVPEPYMRIRLADITDFLQQNPGLSKRDKLLEYLSNPEHNGALRFSPSGIAIHPHSGHYFILSAPGRMLAVYSREGKPLALHRFDKDIFQQPEGICFDSRGTLYIASEGKEGGKGIIAVFPKQN